MRCEGPPTCRTERSGKVKGTMGRSFGVKNGCREGKLERRRRTPVQPESAMRGGADEREARAEADVVVSACDTESDGDWTVGRGRSRQSEVRQKGLTKSEGCEGSAGKASLERGWKGLGWAKRES